MTVRKSLKVVGGREVSVRSVDRDEGIDPYSLFVPSPMTKDSQKVQARVESDQYAMVESLICSGVFKWKTPSDFTRWCFVEGLEKAARIARDPDVNDAVKAMNISLRTVRLRKKMADLEGMLKDFRLFLGDLVKRGALRQVKKQVKLLRVDVAHIKDEFWRDSAMDVLNEYEELAEKLEGKSGGGSGRKGRVKK